MLISLLFKLLFIYFIVETVENNNDYLFSRKKQKLSINYTINNDNNNSTNIAELKDSDGITPQKGWLKINFSI